MSIAELATGDTVYIVRESAGTMGRAVTYTLEGEALSCLVQEVSAGESSVLDALGHKRGYEVFFASDPGISGDEPDLNLLWVSRADSSRAVGNATVGGQTGFRMKVIGSYTEGPPGTTELWIVVCSTTQQRGDGS